ncbi:MAG TPA: DUF4397 domain-containing protein [Capsulimonadaceae bacterium]|nr:DUF4397 domain-containing protein [Capsulimonadaceae bacterium]
MHTLARKALILGLIAPFAALLVAVAGCTGSSSTQSTQVRFINAVPNGGIATFSNAGVFEGNEPFFQQSPYRTVVSTASTTFSFFLAANPAQSFTSASTTLLNATPYSAIAMGRQDVSTTGDARIPQIQVVQDDQTAPLSGDIRLRIFVVAPDLSNVNVLVNGTKGASAVSYPSLGTAFNFLTANLTLQVLNATTSAAVTTPIQFTGIVSGHHYTAFVVEPTITPTYTIDLIDDTTNTLLTPAP